MTSMRSACGWVFLCVQLLFSCAGPARAEQQLPGSGLAEDVRRAIDQGVEYLSRSMAEDGFRRSWYPMGTRSLHVYALVESGVPPGAGPLREIFQSLERLPLEKVYSVALYAMALDAAVRHGSGGASSSGRGGIVRRARGKLRARLKICIDWLVAARVRGEGIWGYGRGGGPRERWVDNSNTQFAVLALQVARRNGIEVPPEVLKEVATRFLHDAVEISSETSYVRCEGAGWWTDSGVAPAAVEDRERGRTAVPRKPGAVRLREGGIELRARPLGWVYRPGRLEGNGRGGGRRWGSTTFSMTSAAVSSLMIVREGLADVGRLSRTELERIDESIAGGVIRLSRIWGPQAPLGQGGLARSVYYDLYSFEKAMDLGGIVLLDGIDWYREQARLLVAAQRQDGAWGDALAGVDTESDRVSTAFALLFLKRATRDLRVSPPTPIVTTAGGAGKEERGVSTGRIFLPSRGGMIDLEELFRLAGEHRTAELMALAREAVEVAPPHERPELLPYLLLIRNGSGDAGDRFARAMVLDLSGLAGNTPGPEVEAWLKRWRQLGVWAGERAEEGVEEMGRILRDRESSIVLQLAAIDGLVRIGSLEGVSPLLDALASVRPEVRSSAHRGLEALLGAGLPFHPNAREETRAVEIVSWRAYWQREGDNLRIRRRWEGLRDALERGRDPAERARVRRAIAALGPAVLPEIEEIIESPSFAFDWLLVWEAITGKRRGF